MRRFIALGVAAVLLAIAPAASASPELSTSDQLNTRRYVSAGDRAYVMGFQDGRFYAQGWHVTGEMGGVWSQPLKLVDGVWFGIGDDWLAPATRFTSGWGYTRMEFPDTDGLEVSRTDFAPDGVRAVLFGLKLRNPTNTREDRRREGRRALRGHVALPVGVDDARRRRLQPAGHRHLQPPRARLPRHRHSAPQRGAARLGRGRRLDPGAGRRRGRPRPLGSAEPAGAVHLREPVLVRRGPVRQGHRRAAALPDPVPAGGERTCGSPSRAPTRAPRARARSCARRSTIRPRRWRPSRPRASRRRATRRSTLPADERLADGIDWGKQNLLDLTQRADDLQIRDVNEGKDYPPPPARCAHVGFIGAGYPDYPWIFATDAEYTAFAAVAAGQFEAIADHARALRDVSVILNGDSGKVVHEVVARRIGVLRHPAARRQHRRDREVPEPRRAPVALDRRRGAAPRPLSLRRAQHALRHDAARRRTATAGRRAWATSSARAWATRSSTTPSTRSAGSTTWPTWRAPPTTASTYAWARDTARDLAAALRSGLVARARVAVRRLADRSGRRAVLPEALDRPDADGGRAHARRSRRGPVSPRLAHGVAALKVREDPCYSGTRPYNLGLFHTGCGGGPEGKGERTIFGLNTAIQAVGEGNYGRLGPDEQKRYTDAEVEPMFAEPYSGGDEVHHTPGTPDEQPGASPEIFPSPDFDAAGPRDANVERCTRCRSMVMQAWNQYGTIWPVIHQQLGVRPDLGRGRARGRAAGAAPRAVGRAARTSASATARCAASTASRQGKRYRTEVDTGTAPLRRLTIGHTLPHGARPGRGLPRRPPPERAGATDQPRQRGHREDPTGPPRPRGRLALRRRVPRRPRWDAP